jgi:hypothetical protein
MLAEPLPNNDTVPTGPGTKNNSVGEDQQKFAAMACCATLLGIKGGYINTQTAR